MGYNKVYIEIANCCDCPYHYKEQIYTSDWFEHEMGVYCSKVADDKSYNKQHKLVAADDWNIREYTQVPDWCPIILKE